MSRGIDAGTLLLRALHTSAHSAACAMEIVDADWVRWASATFNGARHSIRLRAAPSPALDRWLTALPEAELALRGNLVADLAIAAVSNDAGASIVRLEALTVEV